MDTVAFEMPLAMCRVVGPWARHAFFCIPATPVADIMQENAKALSRAGSAMDSRPFAREEKIQLPGEMAGGTGILVLSDELNHRSIVEGVRLSGCTVRAFQHNNMTALETELNRAIEQGQASGKPWRKIFVVVEGIYSMEGDFCRLREIVSLKNKYGAYLYLDEAHSIGAVGRTGRGVTELLGVPTREVDVMMGTFTKSFGSAGGYVAASKEVIAQLRRVAPGSVFAGAMAPPCAAQALQALRVISGEEGGDTGAKKLAAIRENANYFREELSRQGFKADVPNGLMLAP
ncbi:Long chain base biosynthesis protein 2d [Durusdinium trenchii]|uniref:serine C-palmitoyltransferase n=1 Tax=Durusdinium trenchii TaxID=1381693 RepID=A0ABP0IBP7_9DINO